MKKQGRQQLQRQQRQAVRIKKGGKEQEGEVRRDVKKLEMHVGCLGPQVFAKEVQSGTSLHHHVG